MVSPPKRWKVENQHGLTWTNGFKTEESAWNRIMASQRRPGESDKKCKARLLREGWVVKEIAYAHELAR